MAAYHDDDMRWSDAAVERAEDSVTDHAAYDGTTDYDWQPDECSAADLCAAIDAATRTFGRLADETATLTTFARRVA